MDEFRAWLEFIKIALSSGTGALIGAGLSAVFCICVFYFLFGVFPANVPLFIATGLGLIFGEGINQLMNNPKRQYSVKQQIVIQKIRNSRCSSKIRLSFTFRRKTNRRRINQEFSNRKISRNS